jgi:uncharacterized membrane protein
MNVFKYEVSISDMEAFWDAEFMRDNRKALRPPRVAFAWGGGVVVFFLLERWVHSRTAAAVVAAIVAVAIFISSAGLVRELYRRSIRRRYLEATDADLGAVTLTTATEYFQTEGKAGQSRVAWGAVQRLTLTAAHAFLYLGPWKAVIVPLGQLDVPMRNELVGLLRAHVPAGAAVA